MVPNWFQSGVASYFALVPGGTSRVTCFFSSGLQISHTLKGSSISEVIFFAFMDGDANAIGLMDCTLEGMVRDDMAVELKAAPASSFYSLWIACGKNINDIIGVR